MDVMKPDLLYIKGRCFRINPLNTNFHDDYSPEKNWRAIKNSYEEEDCLIDYNDSEEEENLCSIETIDNNRFRTAFHVARVYFPLIIGTKGATRKRLENETKTQIQVPKFGQDGNIVITGNTRSGIQTAFRRINLIIMTARRRQQFTHFISVPFISEQIKQRFLNFKREVLEECKDRGVQESVFQSPDKLHLTVCTMVLSDDVERKNASDILENCKTDVIHKILLQKPLKIKLCGIEIMNDDPSEVSVLYGKIQCENENPLQMLADEIMEYFAKSGIIERKNERVKLHVTLMNSKFSTPSDIDINKRNRNTINATQILKHFQNYDFGEEVVDTIHLSQMGAYSNTGYYKSSFTIKL